MDRFRDQLKLALMHSARERRLVAYGRDDQEPGRFCVGWFMRFEDDAAIFVDVPKDVFGGRELKIAMHDVEWIRTDTPYLRGLEQIWLAGEAYDFQRGGETFFEFEYIETVLKEAWEAGHVVELKHLKDELSGMVQILDIDEETVCLQDLLDDDASSFGTRMCRIKDIEWVLRNSAKCFKMELLLGMPRRSEHHAER